MIIFLLARLSMPDFPDDVDVPEELVPDEFIPVEPDEEFVFEEFVPEDVPEEVPEEVPELVVPEEFVVDELPEP